MATIYLQSVVCIDASETGEDEVYIKYNIDGGSSHQYPSSGYHSMDHNSSNPWVTNLKFEYNDTLEIKLYDKDDISNDDELGSHTYSTKDATGTLGTLVLNSDEGSRYVLVTGPSLVS